MEAERGKKERKLNKDTILTERTQAFVVNNGLTLYEGVQNELLLERIKSQNKLQKWSKPLPLHHPEAKLVHICHRKPISTLFSK